MRILVTGAGGFLGRHLVPALAADGHMITRLVRTDPRDRGEFRWDPATAVLDPGAVADCDAVLHLAGESIAGGRWTAARRRRIRESRVVGTRLLAGAMARAPSPARALLSASAVGFYGDRGDELLDEASEPGGGFLAEVVRAWEEASGAAAAAGVRVVHLRLGVVLAADGGALPRLALPFRLGAGGPLGSGLQWMSWIALDDVLGAVRHALARPDLAGPVNVVASEPVLHRDFVRTLGKALGRPAWLPLPAWALRLVLGDMGRELLLFSQRVMPVRLLESGYAFRCPRLEDALRQALSGDQARAPARGGRRA